MPRKPGHPNAAVPDNRFLESLNAQSFPEHEALLDRLRENAPSWMVSQLGNIDGRVVEAILSAGACATCAEFDDFGHLQGVIQAAIKAAPTDLNAHMLSEVIAARVLDDFERTAQGATSPEGDQDRADGERTSVSVDTMDS